METVVPLGGTAVDGIRQECSDSEVSDDGSSPGGGVGLRPLRLRPLYVVRGWMTLIVLYLVVFQTSWSPGMPRRSICLVLDKFRSVSGRICRGGCCADVLAHSY